MSELEAFFDLMWRVYAPPDAPEPQPEYVFARPRRWRFDRAWPTVKIAVEIEGGVYSGGRHTRGAGFTHDCQKYNTATLLGWRILRFTGPMLQDDPEQAIGLVTKLLMGYTVSNKVSSGASNT